MEIDRLTEIKKQLKELQKEVHTEQKKTIDKVYKDLLSDLESNISRAEDSTRMLKIYLTQK